MLSYNSFSQNISISRSQAIEIQKGLLQGEKLKQDVSDYKQIVKHQETIIAKQDGVIVAQDSLIYLTKTELIKANSSLVEVKDKLHKNRVQKIVAFGLAGVLILIQVAL